VSLPQGWKKTETDANITVTLPKGAGGLPHDVAPTVRINKRWLKASGKTLEQAVRDHLKDKVHGYKDEAATGDKAAWDRYQAAKAEHEKAFKARSAASSAHRAGKGSKEALDRAKEAEDRAFKASSDAFDAYKKTVPKKDEAAEVPRFVHDRIRDMVSSMKPEMHGHNMRELQQRSGVPMATLQDLLMKERRRQGTSGAGAAQDGKKPKKDEDMIEGKTTHWKGDEGEYTGETEQRHGATWHAILMKEGPKKGQKVWTQYGPGEHAKPDTSLKGPKKVPQLDGKGRKMESRAAVLAARIGVDEAADHKEGDTVSFESEGKKLTGTLTRVVKHPRPFSEPSADPKEWTAHVDVKGDARTGGTYQTAYHRLKKAAKDESKATTSSGKALHDDAFHPSYKDGFSVKDHEDAEKHYAAKGDTLGAAHHRALAAVKSGKVKTGHQGPRSGPYPE
jgi:hypothetical protein